MAVLLSDFVAYRPNERLGI